MKNFMISEWSDWFEMWMRNDTYFKNPRTFYTHGKWTLVDNLILIRNLN
jgi:hypothetical protein